MSVIIATGFAELPDDVGTITRLCKPYTQHDLAQAVVRSRKGAAERIGRDRCAAARNRLTISTAGPLLSSARRLVGCD